MEALADTGATVSCIDQRLVEEQKLPFSPVHGVVELAHAGVDAKRLGVCGPLPIRVLFLHSELQPVSLTSSFEVLPLAEGFGFYLGTDLLKHLFPAGVPTAFQREGDTPSSVQPIIHSASSSATAAADPRLVDGLNELKHEVHDAGAGPVPEMEKISGISTSTDVASEAAYAIRRQEVMMTLQPLLEANAALSGFCNMPESIVQLHVDPEQRGKLFRRQYPIPKALEELAHQVIMRWLATGKIIYAPTNNPFNNPITVAPKRDATTNRMTGIRVCLDTRALNAALVVTDKFPLPSIPEILESFAGCVVFGEFDLSEAYLQFRLHEDAQPYTAFTWRGVQYMFVGAPFGITSLPGYFQRVMSLIFRDLAFARPYLDNIPVGSTDWEQHTLHCSLIISRLNAVNLQLKTSSVKVGQSQLRILGHQLSAQGIGLDPDKLQDLRDWQPPTTGKQLQSFLGFVQFLRGHVRHFAELTAPLEAVKNESVVEYDKDPALMEAFNATRSALMKAPILRTPDFERPFHVATDASNVGIGAVLFQPSSDEEYITPNNIVAICSKILSQAQRRYPAYKKELCAVVYALRKFHYYLWGRADTVLVTDHKPLTFILTSKQLAPALEGWLDVITNYSFRIVHRPGVLHVVPDQLSRMFAQQYEASSHWGVAPSSADADDRRIVASAGRPATDPVEESLSAIQQKVAVKAVSTRKRGRARREPQAQPAQPEAQAETAEPLAMDEEAPEPDAESRNEKDDPASTLSFLPSTLPTPLDKSMADTQLPSREGEGSASAEALQIELERRGKTAPPEDDRRRLVSEYHLRGHFGRDAVYKKLYADGFWWPRMRRDIDDELSACDACIRFVVVKAGYHPAESISALLPGDHWQMDCSTHMPESPDGYTAILHIIDVCTGFTILRPMKNITGEAIAKELLDIIALLGPPKILQSDNGPEFVNDVMRAFTKLNYLEHRFILPYNPRADGKVERSVGVTVSVIKKFLYGANENWPLFVPFAQMAYNDKIAALTGSSPYALMFGRRMNHLTDYVAAAADADVTHVSPQSWKEHQEKVVALIFPAISDRVQFLKAQMRRTLNKHRRLLLGNSIPQGAVVMLKDATRRNKFEPKYVGPYSVVRRAQNGGYVLRDATGDILDRHVPPDQLKVVSKAPRPLDSEPTYVVRKILDHRGEPGAREYLVDWKGYREKTWEPETNFDDYDVIKAYWEAQGQQAQ